MLSTAVSAILTNTLMSHSDQCCQSFSASLRCRNLFPTHRRRRAPSGKGPSTNKKSRSSSPEPGASDAAPGASAPRSSGASRKPKGSGSSGGGGGNSSNTDMMFVLSDRLARILQDDAHQIRRKNLVPLPRDPTVSRILSDFSEFATLERSADKRVVREVCEGLRQIFCIALPSRLLYGFEKYQYAETIQKNIKMEKMDEFYGAEHLLRLFVILEELLPATVTDKQLECMRLLLEFFEEHEDIFETTYVSAPPPYVRMSHLAGM
eukprot:m.131781 g.131781  ORF g.131781 m.131781 type:complete len:264 (+) comp9819_c0_seq5:135-926(+)